MTYYPLFRLPEHTWNRLAAGDPSSLTVLDRLLKSTTTLTERWLIFSPSSGIPEERYWTISVSCRTRGKSLSDALALSLSAIRYIERERSTLSLTSLSAEKDWRAKEIGLEDGWIISLTVGLSG